MSAPGVASVLQETSERLPGVVIGYVDDGGATAHSIWPWSCRKAAGAPLSVRALDRVRRARRSFRLDRIAGAHLFSGPPGRGPPGAGAGKTFRGYCMLLLH